MTDPVITPELIRKHGLSDEEYENIKRILGREPTFTELGIFSVMWSEHCSYKNTKPLLKLFPTKSCCVLVGAGEENAGVLDIGDGLAIAFKMESHNHPSAVEPFQGAATGIGGIIRDIFTMGARPICCLDSLRFGDLDSPEVRRLFNGVVSGIAHYGNCIGIPTVGGEVCFDPSYEGNPLVNVFCLGVLWKDQIARGTASGIGNPVFYVGPATGRDGLAGAAFASQDLTEDSAEHQRGAVQVGDPFMEKLVLEACLELLATGCVTGIQDMGAAGLTCSTCETAARANTGIEIELTKVPQRAPNMTPYEIMLSESQERMLIIVEKGKEYLVEQIFNKWDLPWAKIGEVTDTGKMVVKNRGEIVAEIPAKKIATESPVYHRESSEPAYFKQTRSFSIHSIADVKQPESCLLELLAWPTIASKHWVYRQYDHMVRNGTIVCPGSDATVIRIKSDSLPPRVKGKHLPANIPEKYIAISVDGNGTYVYLDPYEGGKQVVAESARNVVCSGAEPIGATDNLNFGNPYNPEIFYQLKSAVNGLADACRYLGIPITGGNVSLYNQNPNGAIDPTPTIAVVGLIRDKNHITTQWFKGASDSIILLGDLVDGADPCLGLGGSAYLKLIHKLKTGTPPKCDLEKELKLHQTLLRLIQNGLVKSAHDCSDGGLAIALAESCISCHHARGLNILVGASVDLTNCPVTRLDAMLFGETQSRVIMSCDTKNSPKVLEICRNAGVPAYEIGETGGNRLEIKTSTGTFSWDLEKLSSTWWNSIAQKMSV